MKMRIVQLATLMVMALGATQAFAGYWSDSSGEVWRNSAGECWHTGYWSPEMAIVGCDGKEAEVAAPAPEPVAPAPVPVAMGTADAKVNFGFDRADLDADAMAAIDTLVREASSRGAIKGARLTGHADRIGAENYNMDLSLRRASAVSDYLVERAGMDAQSIEVGGKGESEPLVACEGERGAAAIQCLAPNRRVEVILDVMGR